jgi:hypothetical protein
MEDCMGYKIGASENPFEDVASDCLKWESKGGRSLCHN